MFNVPFLKRQCKRDKNASVPIEGRNIKLVIGLGNPGADYQNTYHNAGFLFVDFLAAQAPGNEEGKKVTWENQKYFRYANVGPLTLIKSNTFMNRSGISVAAAMKCFDVKPEEVLIAHDESDLDIGTYKLSLGRGSAGHKGIESITRLLGTNGLLRLRIGVRYDARKAREFVLEKLSEDQEQVLQNLFAKIQRLYFKAQTK